MTIEEQSKELSDMLLDPTADPLDIADKLDALSAAIRELIGEEK